MARHCPVRVVFMRCSHKYRLAYLGRRNAEAGRKVETVFRRLLVPLDGTTEAEHAVPTASTIAAATGAEMRLLGSVSGANPANGDLSAAGSYLDGVARKLAATGLRVGTQVRPGDASDGVLSALSLLSADLVVMATSHAAWRKVLSRSGVPLVLVPPDVLDGKHVKRLLVAVDGSVGATLALGVACELARRLGADLVLLQVVTTFPAWAYERGAGVALGPYMNPEWDAEAAAGAQRHVDGLASQIEGDGLRVEAKVAVGSVPQKIVETASEVGADMIVMGAHAHPAAVRAVLESVANAVVAAAPVPVLIVRQEAETALLDSSRPESVCSTALSGTPA